MTRILLLFCLLAFLLPSSVDAQRVRIKTEDLKNISEVKMEIGHRTYPKSLLYKVNRSSMIVVRESSDFTTEQKFFIPSEVKLDEFDYITIYNRKRKIWAQIIGGIGLAATSYFVVDQIYDNKTDNVFLEILNQPTQHRFVEPIVAGIIGGGVGVILGDLLHPIRINVQKDKKRAYQKLKQYSYR